MKATHTPGPWTVVRLEGRTSYKLFNPDVTSESEAEANRKAIETVPEIVDALERLLACACPTGMDTETDRAMEQARAALAKAKE